MRLTLEKSNLEAFKHYLNLEGIEWRETGNKHQVIQVKKDNEWLAIFYREGNRKLLTVDKRLGFTLEAFHNYLKDVDFAKTALSEPKNSGVDYERAVESFKELSKALQKIDKIEAPKKPLKIDWLYVVFFTIVLLIGLFVGYGIKTQCPNLADNVYIKCYK